MQEPIINTTVIVRRDAGGVQYVLSEGAAGFAVTGVDKTSKKVVIAKPCDNLDDGLTQFKKALDRPDYQ